MAKKQLVDLEPQWIMPGSNPCVQRHMGPAEARASGEKPVGLWFWCPACPRTHGIGIPFLECDPEQNWLGGPGAPQWEALVPEKLEFTDLTIHPSINCTGGKSCLFHGWVKRGEVSW